MEDGIVIEIKNLHKSFGENKILKGLDLTLHKSENLVILGKSGSGKSVLIKCIVGLTPFEEGSINVLGKEVNNIKPKELEELRKNIGFLFQSAALYDSMSVRENMLFPLDRVALKLTDAEKKDKVEEALSNVGLADSIDKMPSELSGGMRKRLGLARTIVMSPQILLYDEPTTGLDSITSGEISELMISIQEKFKTSSIIITHDMPCAKATANRIVILSDGKELGQGTYESLASSENNNIKAFFNH